MNILTDGIQNIALAAGLGAVLGLEREWSGKAAGFRTLMLVSLGAALFTVVSYQMAYIDVKHQSDVTRIASNIVTGIGFLGAGLIFKSQQNVHGLTTAATVWAAAAIGMAAGMGNYWLAIEATIIAWSILVVLHYIEKLFEARFETRHYLITYTYEPDMKELHYEDFFPQKGYKLLSSKLEKDGNNITAKWVVRASEKNHDRMVDQLIHNERITGLQY